MIKCKKCKDVLKAEAYLVECSCGSCSIKQNKENEVIIIGDFKFIEIVSDLNIKFKRKSLIKKLLNVFKG